MNSNDKVVVLLPLYKGDCLDYFRLALESMLNQTHVRTSIYIGVDGPIKEEVAAYLKEMEQDHRIRVFYYPENRGLAAVLNDLLEVCLQEGTTYIARMDADDISCPDRLEKQLCFLELHPETDVVGGAIAEIDERGKSLDKVVHYPETSAGCRLFFRYRNPLAHPAVLFRDRFFKKAGFYRVTYKQNQDTLLWFDGFKNSCQFANLPDVVLNFRMTGDLFKKRRNGFQYAVKCLKDRWMINRGLHYGLTAYLFAFMMFLISISPVFIKRLAYKLR